MNESGMEHTKSMAVRDKSKRGSGRLRAVAAGASGISGSIPSPTSMNAFPPYGFMPTEIQSLLPLASVNPRFRTSGGQPMPRAQWDQWMESLADCIAQFLWPRYANGAWQKCGIDPVALTMADLRMLPGLAGYLDLPVSRLSLVTHRSLFDVEDRKRPVVSGYLHYDPAPEKVVLSEFDRLLSEGGLIADDVSLEMKQRLQRPRPNQAAFLLNPGMRHEYIAATTGVTPSIVSGHCIQASMALVNVVDGIEAQRGKTLDATTLERMQQYFMDIGDRRVFAGVHYPSDNLASWWCMMKIIPMVFIDSTGRNATSVKRAKRARDVLLGAIQSKSTVWEALSKSGYSSKEHRDAQDAVVKEAMTI